MFESAHTAEEFYLLLLITKGIWVENKNDEHVFTYYLFRLEDRNENFAGYGALD